MPQVRVLHITRKARGEGFVLKNVEPTGDGAKIKMPPTLYGKDLGPGVADLLDSLVREQADGDAPQGWVVDYSMKNNKHYIKNPVRR
ncbi:hypothetical protein HY639_03525 [Candidatus Woesearchaeota archaeon]|nr:hypothetical protein [Candidatus Woesearchaeota archaeon]